MTTTELSTSIPTDTASPDMEIRLMVMPEKYISRIAKIRLIGMLQMVMIVGLILLRKRNSTMTAKIAPHSRLFRMEETIRCM